MLWYLLNNSMHSAQVDLRYQSIKEADFSISVRLNGRFIATTAADSPWTEGAGMKTTYKGRHYTDVYKALERLGQWVSETSKDRPQLPPFDQATLFSGYNVFRCL